MKSIITALVILFVVLQYQLWFAKGGLLSAWQLQNTIAKQTAMNTGLQKRNDRLVADVKDLKSSQYALEERARTDLGMIKKDETFYQVVKSENNHTP